MASLIAKKAQYGQYVNGDSNSMVNFHYPLRPTAWGQCQQRLAKQVNFHVVKILEFLDGVSECLDQMLSQDITLVITLLDQTITRKTPRRTKRYRKVNIERRNNVMEMNRCLSLMHLFYLFYKIG